MVKLKEEMGGNEKKKKRKKNLEQFI